MKTILIFGDSLTWGSNPEAGGARHARADRWPHVLGQGLGPGVEIIVEAMRGRTTAFDDHLVDGDRNGARILPTLLYSHAPLDLVILMLGCNDMKPGTAGDASCACLGMKRCLEIVTTHSPRLPAPLPPPKLLVVAPPPQVPTQDPFYATLFGDGAPAQSARLAGLYTALAVEFGCAFIDAGKHARAHPADGVHLDADNTRAIGQALIAPVRALLEI